MNNDYITRSEFEEYQKSNNERFNVVEYELLKVGYSNAERDEILKKIAKRDFSWSDMAQRDAMIKAMYLIHQFSSNDIACKFNISKERVLQIVNK
jgi:DNA-directed RNA polymerase specialized sigma subunit